MAKEKKAKKVKKVKTPKVKSEGRKPTLAPFVDAPFKLYASYKEKEYTAQVLKSGVIVFEEKEYATPSQLGKEICGMAVNGWKFFSFNQDDKRVPLDAIRGAKSPIMSKAKKVAA